MIFRCPSIQAHCNKAVIYLHFRTPKNNEFSIWNITVPLFFLFLKGEGGGGGGGVGFQNFMNKF